MKERRKRRKGRLRGRLRKLTGMARRGFFCLLLTGPVLLMCAPVFLLLSGSIMSSQELSVYLQPLFQGGEGYISWRALPFYPTLEHYRSLLLYTPQFFTVFWNSARLVTIILAGQLLVGVPAAWGFAVYRFRGKKLFFYHIYCAYASAFPGDHAFPVSGALQGGSDEYALGGYFTGGFFHVPGVFDLQGVLHNSVRAAGGGKN